MWPTGVQPAPAVRPWARGPEWTHRTASPHGPATRKGAQDGPQDGPRVSGSLVGVRSTVRGCLVTLRHGLHGRNQAGDAAGTVGIPAERTEEGMSDPEQQEALQAEINRLRERVETLETQVLAWEAFAEEVLTLGSEAKQTPEGPSLSRTFLRLVGERAAAMLHELRMAAVAHPPAESAGGWAPRGRARPRGRITPADLRALRNSSSPVHGRFNQLIYRERAGSCEREQRGYHRRPKPCPSAVTAYTRRRASPSHCRHGLRHLQPVSRLEPPDEDITRTRIA